MGEEEAVEVGGVEEDGVHLEAVVVSEVVEEVSGAVVVAEEGEVLGVVVGDSVVVVVVEVAVSEVVDSEDKTTF